MADAGGHGWQWGAAAGLPCCLLMRALIRNSRMCWSIWRHKGLYLCRSSRRWSPPRSWGWIPGTLHLTLHWTQQVDKVCPTNHQFLSCSTACPCWCRLQTEDRGETWGRNKAISEAEPRVAVNVYLPNRWGNCLYDLNTNKDDRFWTQLTAIYTRPR